MSFDIIRHLGKKFLIEIFCYFTGTDFNKATYFDSSIEESGPFTIFNLYTDQAKITFSIGEDGFEILDKENYNDN